MAQINATIDFVIVVISQKERSILQKTHLLFMFLVQDSQAFQILENNR